MKQSTLICLSLLADGLDILIIGQVPGLSWLIDIPIIAAHVAFAGPAGLKTVIELVPVVGTLPLFTLAALSHRKHA